MFVSKKVAFSVMIRICVVMKANQQQGTLLRDAMELPTRLCKSSLTFEVLQF